MADQSIPSIRLSDSARRILREAMVDADGDWLRLRIDERFQHELRFEPGAEGDIVVDADGISLLLDPASVGRAAGLAIDYGADLHGAGFRFDNPNQPDRAQPGPDQPARNRQPGRPQSIELIRDCGAILIPRGEPLQLTRGERVRVTQALGGSFTVQTANGQLARIAGRDADALGLDARQDDQPQQAPASASDLVSRVLEVLRGIYDPEIPVNLVDLGLIYQCQARPLAGGGQRVEIQLSMTAPGCGMGEVLKDEARAKVQAIPGVNQVDIELVWEPPWEQSRMSEAALLQLGLL